MQRILLAMLAFTVLAAAQVREAPRTLTLEQAIEEAIAGNLDLAAEKLNISIAEAREITARLRPNPVLTISGQTLDLLGAHFEESSPVGPNQFNFHTDIPLERGGKRKERMALAREDTSLVELEVREVMRHVISNVQSAFVDVLQAKENLKLAEDNLKNLHGVVEINQARLRSGDLSQLEFNRSQVAEMQSEAVVKQTQLQLDQSKIRLQQLLGWREKRTDFDVTGDLGLQIKEDPPAEILRLALMRRPDYLASRQAQN
ncbi:MAG: TolC family protein, partial [Bryobacterales bacterium]|nr:TolC family protein [Bryobacterales bacterium]